MYNFSLSIIQRITGLEVYLTAMFFLYIYIYIRLQRNIKSLTTWEAEV